MKNFFLLITVLFAIGAHAQCACCAGAGIGSANGDYNSGILTLPRHKRVAEFYADYRDIKNGDAVEDDEKLLKNMLVMSAGLRYGVTSKFTMAALLPYVFLYTADGSDKGFGDLIVLGTYSAFRRKGLNIALQAGVELPTGVQKASNFDNTVVVVGSGSYDPMAGIVASKIWKKLALQGNILYKLTTKGFEGNYYGSLNVHSLSLAYKVREGSSFCASDTTGVKTGALKKSDIGVNASAGYYGEWLDKIKEDGIVDPDSGHYLGFLILGTNITAKSWSFPFTFSLPFINEVNGGQNESGCRVRLGILRSF